jgi:NADH dehydrogenase
MEQRVVTILGGTGFLGRYVVQQLARSGYRLRVIARNPSAAIELITSGHVGQISLIAGDITKPESYAASLKGSYAVVNLVGILFESGKRNFTEVHSLGAEKLAIAASAAGVKRFIQISALGVEHEFGSSYARSKFLGEQAVMSAFPKATILRPSIMFGAEDNFFNKFAKMASIAPALPLIGGGKTKFQPVYVGDVAHAIEVCLTEDETRGQIYELGGPHTYSFKQILEYILLITGKSRALVKLPFGVASFIGRLGEFCPTPPLTRDQVKLLKYDNTVNPSLKSFAHLGITPTAVEMIVPEYLSIYNKKTAA